MKSYLILVNLILSGSIYAQSPTVVVNPDGTHSVMHKAGGTAVIVNPNGTHSVVHNANTSTPVIINPDGTHTILHETRDRQKNLFRKHKKRNRKRLD